MILPSFTVSWQFTFLKNGSIFLTLSHISSPNFRSFTLLLNVRRSLSSLFFIVNLQFSQSQSKQRPIEARVKAKQCKHVSESSKNTVLGITDNKTPPVWRTLHNMLWSKCERTPGYLVFASSLFPDVEGNAVGLFFGAKQINVVGNEELACASHCGPPGGYKCGRTVVWGPLTLFEL